MRGCRPLRNEEIEAVLTHLSIRGLKREKAIFLLGIRQGLTIDAILNLKIRDISEQGRVADKIWVRPPTATNRRKGYSMPLHPQAAEALRQYLDVRKGSSGYVFKGRYPYTHLRRIQAWQGIADAFRELNIIGYHGELGSLCMRKTYARLVYTALKGDLVKTKYALRHASILSTCRFLSFNETDVDTAITSL